MIHSHAPGTRAPAPPRSGAGMKRLLWLLLALAGTLAGAAPAAAQTLSGEFHLIWRVAASAQEPVQVSYHLTDDAGRTHELELEPESLQDVGGPMALNRRRVTARVVALSAGAGQGESRLRVVSLVPAEPVAAEDAPLGAVQNGPKAYATVLCRFADSTAVQPHPASHYEALLTGTSTSSLDHYWREVSDGRVNLGGGKVAGWYNLPRTRAQYFPNGLAASPNWSMMVSDCTAAADADVDFRLYVGVNMQFNTHMPASWGGSAYVAADGVNRVLPMTWMAPWAGHAVYAHEMGHSFGLPHSSGPYAETYDSEWDVMSDSYVHWDASRSDWIGQHTVIYHKDILGWVPAAQRYVPAAGSRQSLQLNRSELPGTAAGYQMVRIPLPAGEFYTVEVRKKVGYDGWLPGEGVIIHRVNPTRPDRAARVVDQDNDGDPNDAGAIWLPGETFRDVANSILVSVDSASGIGFGVTVSVAAPVTLPPDSIRRVAVVQRPYADTLRAEGGVGTFTWSVTAGALPPGLSMDGAGVLSGTATAEGTFRFTARAASGSVSASREFRLQALHPVAITSDSVRTRGKVGVAYADTLRASGATGTYTWTVAAGSVPPGIALDANSGILSGTPTADGVHRFTVAATSGTLADSLRVVARFTRPLAVPADSVRRAGTMGAAYADTLHAEGGEVPPVWRVLAGQLPPGVALDSLTGALSGVPRAAGQFRFTAGVRSADESAEKPFVVAVAKPQLQPAAVVDQLLGGTGLSADQARFLDLLGNGNGRVDVGDVRAWLTENQQINLSENPVLLQIMTAEPAQPDPAQPSPSRGEP